VNLVKINKIIKTYFTLCGLCVAGVGLLMYIDLNYTVVSYCASAERHELGDAASGVYYQASERITKNRSDTNLRFCHQNMRKRSRCALLALIKHFICTALCWHLFSLSEHICFMLIHSELLLA